MKVVWESGAAAEFVELGAGDRVALASGVAAAPGTPLVGTSADGTPYSVKVRTCRKVDGGTLEYRIEGRLFNVTRSARAALAASLGGSPPPPDDPSS